MRRIGEVFVTVAVLAMVTGLTLADQIRRKVCGDRRKPSPEAHAGRDGDRVESKETSRAESVILHVL